MHNYAEPDPHDPLAPRPDDPRIGRWWWRARLYDEAGGRRSPMLRWLVLAAAMLLVGLGALAVVALAGSR